MLSVASRITDASWPAIPTSRASQLLAVQFQLEQSQWLPAEKLRQFQWQQLQRIVQHAYQHVPFYRERDRSCARQNVDSGAQSFLSPSVSPPR
jgi:hypothetical protein